MCVYYSFIIPILLLLRITDILKSSNSINYSFQLLPFYLKQIRPSLYDTPSKIQLTKVEMN